MQRVDSFRVKDKKMEKIPGLKEGLLPADRVLKVLSPVYNKIVPHGNIPITVNFYKAFRETVELFDIPNEKAFFAQVCYESNYFKCRVENLFYSAHNIVRVFGKYVNHDFLVAEKYAMRPKKLAMLVYNRRSLGNRPGTTDAWDYRGQGYIQLTGRRNYILISKDLDIDYVSNPNLLRTLPHAWFSAGWYWIKHDCHKMQDFKQITKTINGGYNGLKKRRAIYSSLF